MNTQPLRNRRGIALVVVLVFLVLLSIFIVGFFSNAQDELTAAQSFTGEVSASHLAESAVSVVMGQIREATTRTNGAWGSQPGMIRVYRDGNNASDKADAFFKLYSSDDMIVSGAEIASFDPAKDVAEGPEKGWERVPALWTNLNEEVKVPVPNTEPPRSVDRYPILDPSLDRQVEGLEFLDNVPDAESSSRAKKARMPVKWLYVLKDGSLTSPSTTGGNGTRVTWKKGEREPTLANPIVGRVAFWTDDETCKVNINTASGFSAKPEDSVDDGGMPTRDKGGAAIGEDEYAGSYWDTPRVSTVFDRGVVLKGADSRKGSDGGLQRGGLALSQPVRGEFQRYPGHPYTTSLGIVFRGRPANAATTMQDAPYLFKSGQLALLSPRLMYSLTNRNERATNYGVDRLIARDYRSDDTVEVESNDQPVNFRVKRLYASVDELFYAQPDLPPKDAQRKQNDWELKVTGVTANDSAKILTADYLEKMRFFLTAHSRAPEVNLFGQPRVTIWPVSQVTSARKESEWWNSSDRLLAFCSTIGPDSTKPGVSQDDVLRYIFQRINPYSSTDDIQIKRNDKLFRYLQDITKKPFPGVGGVSFEQKYKDGKFGGDPKGRDQVLVEIFDYIRTVNMRDSTRDKAFNEKYPQVNGAWPTVNIQVKEKYKYAPRGIIVPAIYGPPGTPERPNPNARHGFGRFPTISEASLVLYHAGYVGTNGKRYRKAEQELRAGAPLDPKKRKVLTETGEPVPGVFVKENLVRAFVVLETFNPMQGYAPTTTPSTKSEVRHQQPIVYEIDGLDGFSFDDRSLGMPKKATNKVGYASGGFYHGRNSGGTEGVMHTMFHWATAGAGPKMAVAPGGDLWYPFQSDPTVPSMVDPSGANTPGIPVSIDKTVAQLKGATLTLRMDMATIGNDGGEPPRTITLNFPDATVQVPTDDVWKTTGPTGAYVAVDPGGFFKDTQKNHEDWACNNELTTYHLPNSLGDWVDSTGTTRPGRLNWARLNSSDRSDYIPPGLNGLDRWRQLFQPGDVVRSVVYGKGDLRAGCLSTGAPGEATVFAPHPEYDNTNNRHAQTLRVAQSSFYYQSGTKLGNIARLPTGSSYTLATGADLPAKVDGKALNGVKLSADPTGFGDFDTGIGSLPDGPYCNKADEGNLVFRNVYRNKDGSISHYIYPVPYFTWGYDEAFDTFFSPNRQVPSPVVFGSLLSGKAANWQTLCFSPNPAAGELHPGRSGPKDYLWLDLFTMPVVEPYAISEPFSTAGKINLNYPIVPFGHIKRTTGLRAALQPVRVTAMPTADVEDFKGPKVVAGKNYRYLVDRDETIKAFDSFFDDYNADHDKGFIKVAAQICDFYLYPRQNGKAVVKWTKNQTTIKQWWNNNLLTGDNVREKPYGDLYPRITTKSNTYCVHVRAQALRQSAPSDPKEAAAHYRTWDEKRDRVVGEYRGSSIIERYIDPQDERFDRKSENKDVSPINPDTMSIDPAYRFRVLNTKRFDP